MIPLTNAAHPITAQRQPCCAHAHAIQQPAAAVVRPDTQSDAMQQPRLHHPMQVSPQTSQPLRAPQSSDTVHRLRGGATDEAGVDGCCAQTALCLVGIVTCPFRCVIGLAAAALNLVTCVVCCPCLACAQATDSGTATV